MREIAWRLGGDYAAAVKEIAAHVGHLSGKSEHDALAMEIIRHIAAPKKVVRDENGKIASIEAVN